MRKHWKYREHLQYRQTGTKTHELQSKWVFTFHPQNIQRKLLTNPQLAVSVFVVDFSFSFPLSLAVCLPASSSAQHTCPQLAASGCLWNGGKTIPSSVCLRSFRGRPWRASHCGRPANVWSTCPPHCTPRSASLSEMEAGGETQSWLVSGSYVWSWSDLPAVLPPVWFLCSSMWIVTCGGRDFERWSLMMRQKPKRLK